MSKIRKAEGITLISLIVTIVVLILLAGITINLGLGENGIIKKAEEAGDAQKIAEYTELLTNVAVGDEIDRIVNKKEIDIVRLEELINEESYVANTEKDEEEGKVTVATNDGYILDVVVKENGDVEVISQGKDDGEPYPELELSASISGDYLKATITVVAIEEKNGIAKIELVGGDGKTYNNEKGEIKESYEVDKNGSYQIRVTSGKGKVKQKTIKITGIRDILNEEGLISIKEPVWQGGQASVEITKSEPFTMQYQINGTVEGSWIEYTSPVGGLNHNDRVYARLYVNGEGGKIASKKIEDKVAPEVVASIGEITTNSIEIKGVNAIDRESGIDLSAEYTYSYKETGEEGYTEAERTTNTSYTYIGLTQGTTYQFKIEVEDKAGNKGEKLLTGTTGSLEGGETALQFGTPVWQGGEASITVSKVDTSKAGEIQYQINGTEENSWTNYSGTITNLSHNDTVYARLWDGINGGSTTSYTILDSIEPTSPALSVTNGTAGTNSWYTSNVAVKITEGTDSQSGVGKTTYKIEGAQTVEETEIINGGTVMLTEEGTSQITAYTYDKAGNRSEGKTIEVKKDTEKPVSFSAGSKDITTTGFTIEGETTDETSGIARYEYYVDNTKQASNVVTGKKEEQEYTCYIRAYDNAGNYIDSSMVKITPSVWRELSNVKTDGSWDDEKGVNTPKLGEGMTAIIAANENNDIWYDYKDQGAHKVDGRTSKWANARTADGNYWVWIPRYEYKIVSGEHTVNAGEIDVKFIKTSQTTPDEGYRIHPAFVVDTNVGGFGEELDGIWVGKFETSHSDATILLEGTSDIIAIKSGVMSWRNISVNDIYNKAYNYNRTLDSHMMKNSEWGAAAYLAHSQYGRNGSEVILNNSSSYITGNAGDSVSTLPASGVTNAYNTTKGQFASTTGNIYGIYDMSGGGWEYMATYINNGNSYLTQYGAALVNAPAKYKNVYSQGSSDSYANNYTASSGKYGDAIYETSTSGTGFMAWFNDYSCYSYTNIPFILRGGAHNHGTGAGIFAFYGYGGYANSWIGFRMVLAPI